MAVLTSASRRSRLLFHWRAHTGLVATINGLSPTSTFGSISTAVDSAGSAYTSVNGQPPWTWLGGLPMLRLDTPNYLYWPFLALPQALSIYVKMRVLSAVASTDTAHGVVHVGNAAGTGAELVLYHPTSVAGYAGYLNNGVSNTSTAGLTGPAVNDDVELMLTMTSGGVLQLSQSIAGAAATTASSGALALPAAWADTRIYLNGIGATNIGTNAFHALKVAAGVRTLAEMRSAF